MQNPNAPLITEVPIHCAHDQVLPLAAFKPNPRNPNRHPPKQIEIMAYVIAKTGWRAPITVSRRSGFIVKGHGRLQAAVYGNMKVAPADYQDYANEEEEYADMLADKKLPEMSSFDKEMTKAILADLKLKPMDLKMTGFDASELERMFKNKRKEAPQFPITADLNERYDYVVIMTRNETDAAYLRTICGVEKEASFKNTNVGLGRVVPFERFITVIKENLQANTYENPNPVNEPKRDDDDAPADK